MCCFAAPSVVCRSVKVSARGESIGEMTGNGDTQEEWEVIDAGVKYSIRLL